LVVWCDWDYSSSSEKTEIGQILQLSNKRIKKDYTIQHIMCETVPKSLLMHHGSPEAYTYRNQRAHRMLTWQHA
jgi:hypothetical protein